MLGFVLFGQVYAGADEGVVAPRKQGRLVHRDVRETGEYGIKELSGSMSRVFHLLGES